MNSEPIPFLMYFANKPAVGSNPMGVLGRYDHAQDDVVRPTASSWRYDASSSSDSSVSQSDDNSQYLGVAKTWGFHVTESQ